MFRLSSGFAPALKLRCTKSAVIWLRRHLLRCHLPSASFGFAVIHCHSLAYSYPLSRFPQGGKAGAPSPLGEGREGGYVPLNDH